MYDPWFQKKPYHQRLISCRYYKLHMEESSLSASQCLFRGVDPRPKSQKYVRKKKLTDKNEVHVRFGVNYITYTCIKDIVKAYYGFLGF